MDFRRTETPDVNSQVQEQRRGKAAQRAAAQRAAAERAAKRRRTQAILGAAGGVLAVILVITFAVLSSRSDDTKPAAAPPTPAAAQTDPADPAAAQPTAPAAPPALPEGADPALATKPTVTGGTGTVDKLVVTPLIEGKGAVVQAGQQITVNYVGVLYKDGTEFDSSWKRGQPATFGIGTGNVIKGWDDGLVGVKVGSRVQLDIPSNLAYGDTPDPSRPSGPLRFVVDVLAAQ
jgi:peptidylprolyl isomerase